MKPLPITFNTDQPIQLQINRMATTKTNAILATDHMGIIHIINEKGYCSLTKQSQLEAYQYCNKFNYKLHSHQSKIGKQIIEAYKQRYPEQELFA
jgi:outer membrane phospholipase A